MTGYIVDKMERVIYVRGQARFMWKKTETAWDEFSAYRLAFTEDRGEWKVRRYEA